MKTIRGKIIFLFGFCVCFVVALAILSYQNTRYLEAKLTIIQSFDDLLDDVLELRALRKEPYFLPRMPFHSNNAAIIFSRLMPLINRLQPIS